MRVFVIAVNTLIFTYCGYLYGQTQTQSEYVHIDKVAVELAIAEALYEQSLK